jgi:uncharacterized protein YecA (UPF0149 family)
MNEYSDEEFQEIQDTVEKWCDAFAETSHFKNLPESVREESWFITSVFGEQMYNYPFETPKEWSVSGLNEVIMDIFPRKITADASMFKAVEPVLTAFFQYLNEMGHIENADTLIKALKKAAPTMVKQATDSSNWGFAKQFAMAAMKERVDFEDKEAMDRFTEMYNAQITSSTTFPAPQIGGFTPKVGRNEPCPCGSGRKYKRCCGKNV